MNFKMKIRKVMDIPVLEITGDVTGDTVGKISTRLETLRKENSRSIAVDLSHTTFIDSHGLGVFVYCWRMLEQENRQLVFLNPQKFIRNMFSGTNLDKIFKVIDSEEQLAAAAG
jgi:anti-anti-sigma factor